MKRVRARSARRRAVGPAPPRFSAAWAFAVATSAALAFAPCAAPPARAAAGLYLTWNDCALGAAAAPDRMFECNVNTGLNTLYCAFTLAQPRDSVLGVEVVVDVQHTAAAMPDWWRFESGGCRAGALNQTNADFTGESACVDPWQGMAIGGIQGFSIGPPAHSGPNQARIKAVAAVTADLAASLDATHMYYALKIVISNEKTTALGPCFGCLPAACLVLNSILVRRLPGSSGDEFVQTPGPANANWATWQGTAANCAAVPVRNTTWGRLKSLYR